MAMDPLVGIVIGIGVHLIVLKPIPINSGWSETYIWTPRSTFYDARGLSYTLKWPRTMLLVYQSSASSLGMYQALKNDLIDKSALHRYRPNIIINKKDHMGTFVNQNKNMSTKQY